MNNRIKTGLALTVIAVVTAFSACGRSRSTGATMVPSPFNSFRDIPGVTAQEIAAIESLQSRYDHFIYGMNHSTDAFPVYDGVGGYAKRVCEWLTGLFDIPFRPELYEWGDLLSKLETAEIHFTGDLIASEERKRTHFMTGAIAGRSLKAFQIAGSSPVTEIQKLRTPRLAFPRGFAPYNYIVENAGYHFEPVFISDYAEAYRALTSGEADALLTMDVAEPALDVYGDVVSETFYPLVFDSVSLSTQIPELEPIITIVQKALDNGGTKYLVSLYNLGHRDYIQHKFLSHLTAEEFNYILRNPVVKIATETDSYPVSFYNANENELQGIAFDIIKELEIITGLSFEVTNAPNTGYGELTAMVERGDADFITVVMRSPERENSFLLTEMATMRDYPVLISANEFSNVQFNELTNVTVGIVRGTTHAGLFKQWFPRNRNFREYDSLDSVFRAMERGEVDMFMSMSNYLLSIENYKELAGYKINIAFDHYFDHVFGFNRNQTVLFSIIDKALRLVDRESIWKYWTNKRYDYRTKVAEAQRPWLIGATVLSLVTLVLILALFYRSRGEKRRLAQMVTEKTSILSAILDATPDLIFCKNLNSITTECNKAIEDYFNMPKAQIIGRSDSEVLRWNSEIKAQQIARDAKVFNEKQVVVFEEFLIPAQGSPRLFETIKTPLLQDGRVTGLVGISRDITERKAAEQSARNASEAKTRFVANMSHEMRTPMNVIVGLTGLLLEENDVTGKIRESLRKISTAGETLMGLINDVLDISKIEAGKLELLPVQYDVPSLFNDIITLNMVRIEDKPVTFVLDIDEKLPCTLFGDDLRIKQMLNNLLSNAFKYTRVGTVTLTVTSQRDNAPDGTGGDVWLSLAVIDTGIGIQKENLTKLFTDYHQVDTRANREIEGTGLGLSITKKFAELMDGEITAESEYGKGSTFRIRIRQGFVTDMPIGRKTVENLRGFRYMDKKKDMHERLVRADLSYARVLVVDDFPTNLDVAAGMLSKYKMQVDCVMRGQDAIELIAAENPVYDAIFMDHMMPELDGIQTTTVIRLLLSDYAKNIPIIALTANAVSGSEEMFLENGFNAFLAKPFNVMSLDSVVQKWVRNKSKEPNP